MSRVIAGLQPVREALRAHRGKVERVWLDPKTVGAEGLQRFALSVGARVDHTPRGDLDRMAHGAKHQGVLAQVPELVLQGIDVLLSAPERPVVALDEIQDPQNFGAIVRSAVALANAAILWPESSSAPLSPAMMRASAGAVEHATLARVPSLRGALRTLIDAGFSCVALEARGGVPLEEVDLTRPTVLLIGSEGFGIHKGLRALATHTARLPMAGQLDSLNASVAAGVALYELIRQRSRPRT